MKASVLLIQAFVRGWKVMEKGRGFPLHMWFLLNCPCCWGDGGAGSKSYWNLGHTSVRWCVWVWVWVFLGLLHVCLGVWLHAGKIRTYMWLCLLL